MLQYTTPRGEAMRTTILLRHASITLCLFLAAASVAEAAAPAIGRLEKITVHGKSLEGNLSQDTADREVFVYLPASYDSKKSQRYPVVYFLHGILAKAQNYVDTLKWPDSINRAISTGKLPEMIFVIPDAMTPYTGSMYSNSITTGDWESFVATDLVNYIDSHYRTLAKRESRGLSGHSMGGYGTLRIGMKRPDVFSVLYAMSSCCLEVRGTGPGDAQLEQLKSREDVEKLAPFSRLTLAAAAAWSPNANRPPLFMDLPTQEGKPQTDVLNRFAANSPAAMVSQYAPQLQRYKRIRMDAGLQDTISNAGTKLTSEALLRVGVAHEYQTYEGDHMSKVPSRFEALLIPFFARELAAR
jgi:enterochelin esterase-like enzyme